jgi:hypothetical protein
MLEWLVNPSDLFGFDGQNWMWVVAGGLALYAVALLIARRVARTH